MCVRVTESSDITRQHFHPNWNFPLHSHAVYEPWLEASRHFPLLPAFLSLRTTCKNWRSCVRLRVCSCALHCDDLRSLRKNFNHLCSSLALVMQQLVYTAYAVIYPPRQWKMWILRCDRWTILLLVWLVAVVFRYFFHIKVLMYIAQIVRELIAGPGGIKNPSLKESEAWHL